MESLLTAREAAKYLKTHRQTLIKRAKNGEVPAIKMAGRWRFRKEEMDRWLDEQRVVPNDRTDL